MLIVDSVCVVALRAVCGTLSPPSAVRSRRYCVVRQRVGGRKTRGNASEVGERLER